MGRVGRVGIRGAYLVGNMRALSFVLVGGVDGVDDLRCLRHAFGIFDFIQISYSSQINT